MTNPHRTTDTIKSLTLLLSLADGANIADLQGKNVRLTIPLNALVFDHHSALPAYFYTVFSPQLGNASTPAPAGFALRDRGAHVWIGNDSDSPRKSAISRLVFDLEIAADAEAFENIPLVIKGYNAATDAPASFTFPVFTASPDPVFEVTDSSGGAISIGIELMEAATMSFTPATPADWDGTAPSTIAAALDRIAAALATETGGPIP